MVSGDEEKIIKRWNRWKRMINWKDAFEKIMPELKTLDAILEKELAFAQKDRERFDSVIMHAKIRDIIECEKYTSLEFVRLQVELARAIKKLQEDAAVFLKTYTDCINEHAPMEAVSKRRTVDELHEKAEAKLKDYIQQLPGNKKKHERMIRQFIDDFVKTEHLHDMLWNLWNVLSKQMEDAIKNGNEEAKAILDDFNKEHTADMNRLTDIGREMFRDFEGVDLTKPLEEGSTAKPNLLLRFIQHRTEHPEQI